MGRTITFASLIAFSSVAALGQNMPQWQTAAGGKMAFEVASIKVSNPDTRPRQNFPLDPTDSFQDVRTRERPNGRFSAVSGLSTYIRFAYKLRLTSITQLEAMTLHLPKWVSTDLFEIEARAPANATKDQMRLMMQALLAERFQLAVHFETAEVPVLAMTLVKPGKPGPGLRPHSEGPSCDAPANPNLFPPVCYLAGQRFTDGGQRKGNGRDLTMPDIAGYLPSWGNLDRPLIDRTGLTGEYDFTVQWKPDPNMGGGRAIPKTGSRPVVAPAPASELDGDGPSFIQALRDQLGLRFESTKAPVESLVIDHVERPSEN
jgi:bla regulator protein blaR1